MSDWLLPENVSDALPSEARHIEQMRRRLLDLYQVYGYELIGPPLIENLESLLTGSGSRMAMRTFQTVDQLSGKTLGVRADITPQAARIDANRLNRKGVSRLCYAGAVLHTRPASALGNRELHQVGVELFGHSGIEAELEALELMIESLQAAQLSAVSIDIGHAAIVPALLKIAGETGGKDWLAALDTNRLHELLVQKDRAGMEAAVIGCPQPAQSSLLSLLSLYGPVSSQDHSAIDLARKALGHSDEIAQALSELEQLVSSSIWARYPKVSLAIDLADLQGYHYYSGVSFTAFAQPADAQAQGKAVARGGRYDGIGRAFGKERAAAGFSLELREVSALGAAGQAKQVDAIKAPWVDDPQLREEVARLRANGEIVVQILPGHEQEQEEFECIRELHRENNQWVLREIK
jgi:ATP phosphoribosyltransferase regulatory subunit